MAAPTYHPLWDRIGIVVTAACAVHCVAMPLLLPLLAATDLLVLAHHEFEWAVLAFTFALAGVVLSHGYFRHHRSPWPLAMAAIGVVVCLLRHDFGEALEPALLAVGAGLLVAAHVYNLRLSRHFATESGDVAHAH